VFVEGGGGAYAMVQWHNGQSKSGAEVLRENIGVFEWDASLSATFSAERGRPPATILQA